VLASLHLFLFSSAFFLTLIAAAHGLMVATWFDHGGWVLHDGCGFGLCKGD
jgi:hypothetical protein